MASKKALIFSTAYLPMIGGAELAVKEITDRVEDWEFDLICARIDKKLACYERIGRVNVYRVGFGSDLDKIFLPFCGFCKVVFLNFKNKYDLIWGLMASHGGLTALFFKLFNPRKPFLLTLQEGDPFDYIESKMKPFWLFKMIFVKANYIQAISNYLAQWGRKMGAKGEIEVIPNGVGLNQVKSVSWRTKIKSEGLKKELNIKDGEKVVVTSSRLVVKNGVADLIEAMSLIDTKNVKLIILGDGELRNELKALAIKFGLEDRVLFMGSVKNEEVFDYLAISDVFVRPSLSEGLGNAFLEAMATGLPIIGTPVGGIPDFLKDPSTSSGQAPTGLFCEVQNPKSLAEKIDLLLSDETLRQKLIINGRKLVEEKYEWGIIAEKMASIFNSLSHF